MAIEPVPSDPFARGVRGRFAELEAWRTPPGGIPLEGEPRRENLASLIADTTAAPSMREGALPRSLKALPTHSATRPETGLSPLQQGEEIKRGARAPVSLA